MGCDCMRTRVFALGIAGIVCATAVAAGYRIRFQPDAGLKVPYKVELKLTGSVDTPMGSQSIAAVGRGRFTDTVVAVGQGGARKIAREFRELVFTMDGQDSDLLGGAPKEPHEIVRDARGRLVSLGGTSPTEIDIMQCLMPPPDPALLAHLLFLMVPYPDGDLDVGAKWDAGRDMPLFSGIKQIEAPTSVREVTSGNPAFAIIESAPHIVTQNEDAMPMPNGGSIPIKVDADLKGGIKQWSALANGLVARAESRWTLGATVATGGATIRLRVDPLECVISYDEEAGRQ